MRRDALVAELDEYFRTLEVRNDDWSETFELLYPEAYWRDFAEPGYEGRWNGLMVRGAPEGLSRTVGNATRGPAWPVFRDSSRSVSVG